MNKKTIGRIAVFALATFLVGYFCYKVAYGNVAQLNSAAAAGLTNRTACVDGWFNGWKYWCNTNAKECLQNFLVGDFPEMIVKTDEQYLAGEKVANDSGTSMCPIGENAAFCRRWDNNDDDYGGGDCGDGNQYANPMYNHIVGCPFDTLKHVGWNLKHVGWNLELCKRK